MTKGYNLPDNISATDPEAPWNDEAEWEPVFTCLVCGREFDSLEDVEAASHTCKEEDTDAGHDRK